MVFESTVDYPTPEGEQRALPAAAVDLRLPEAGDRVLRPGAWEQYRLPYTIVRPFNCVGVGETRALGDKEVLLAATSSWR